MNFELLNQPSFFGSDPMQPPSIFGNAMNAPPQPQMPQQPNLAARIFGGGLMGQDLGLDPEVQKRAQQQALLQAGLQMMSASGRKTGPRTGLGEILSGGLQAGAQGYQGALRSGLAGQEYKEKQENKAAAQAASQGVDYNSEESMLGYGQKLMQLGRNDEAKIAFDRADALAKRNAPKDMPADVQAYEFARTQDPSIGSYADWTMRKTRAGATNVSTNVNVSGEKKFAETLGTKVGEQVAASTQAARGAVGTINTVNRIREALQGNPYMGPGASIQQTLAQVGEKLGIVGKDTTERLTNTRATIQGLSQLNLDAAEQMRGQGQITEAERALLAKSVGGEFDKLTTGELSTLLDLNERIARFKIETNQMNVDRLRKQPGTEGIVDYFDVPAPAPFNPMPRPSTSAPANGGFRFLGAE